MGGAGTQSCARYNLYEYSTLLLFSLGGFAFICVPPPPLSLPPPTAQNFFPCERVGYVRDGDGYVAIVGVYDFQVIDSETLQKKPTTLPTSVSGSSDELVGQGQMSARGEMILVYSERAKWQFVPTTAFISSTYMCTMLLTY